MFLFKKKCFATFHLCCAFDAKRVKARLKEVGVVVFFSSNPSSLVDKIRQFDISSELFSFATEEPLLFWKNLNVRTSELKKKKKAY